MFAQSQADTLDIATQFVSLMSIVLAQYTYSSKDEYHPSSKGDLSSESNLGKAVATVLFFGINLVLVIAHLSLIAVPLRDQMSTKFVQVQDFYRGRLQSETSAEGANSQVLVYS